MISREVHLAGGNQKIPVNQVDDAIGQIGREIRAVVRAAVLAQPPRHVNPGKALAQRELYIRISLIIAEQDVEPRLLLLDKVIFERQRLFVISDDDVIDVRPLPERDVPVLASSQRPSWKYELTRLRRFFALPT